MQKPIITIDIISDVVCPWCYIGKRRLEKAIQSASDNYTFQLTYHPFELNPNIPATGLNQKEYLSDKFGGEERYYQITEHTTSVAASEGLLFNFEKQKISPNTRKAHSVIQLAKIYDKQLEVVEAFFQAYFTDAIDLSKDENIISIATNAGLIRDIVEQYLTSNESNTNVLRAEEEIRKLGISGVPFYIVSNKYGISGAQNPETFIKAFEDSENFIRGNSCGIEKKVC